MTTGQYHEEKQNVDSVTDALESPANRSVTKREKDKIETRMAIMRVYSIKFYRYSEMSGKAIKKKRRQNR